MQQFGRSPRDTNIHFLESELQDREDEIALLKEIAVAVSSELNIEKVFQLVSERARLLIQAETLLIPVLNSENTHYTYRAGCGKNSDEIVGETLPLEYGICGWVWRNKRAWWRGVLSDLEEQEKNKWEYEAGHVILVPLIGKGHFLGGIAGINKLNGGDFTKRDLDLLTLFASQVSVAIENASLFAESEHAKLRAENYQRELEYLNNELAETNRQLEHLALHDSLTNLPNRSLILDRIQQSIFIAKRENKPFAVLMMDLNRFKEVNDTLGHDVGDKLLKKVSLRVQKILREVDMVGRLGGDEFIFIVPGAGIAGAILVANKLKAVLERPFRVGHYSLYVLASFGIAVYPHHGTDVSTLLKRVDVAMYVAKRENNDYFVYDPAEDLYSPRRLAQLGELRKAVDENELILHYQPKVDLKSGEVVGVEALARWPYLGRYFIPPVEFIPMLEQTGLIRPFTQWVLNTALQQYSEWRKSGFNVSMAVNLSMYSLRDPQLISQLSELIRKWKISRGMLILELTESAFMYDPVHIMDTLLRLNAMGIELSIDDFGTGYSSLSYLKRLPVQEIKIDQSFVQDMANDKDDAAIVRSIIELAHNLGLRVVAEGVENRMILDLLADLNCDKAQGHYISQAHPADELVDLLGKTNWPMEPVRNSDQTG